MRPHKRACCFVGIAWCLPGCHPFLHLHVLRPQAAACATVGPNAYLPGKAALSPYPPAADEGGMIVCPSGLPPHMQARWPCLRKACHAHCDQCDYRSLGLSHQLLVSFAGDVLVAPAHAHCAKLHYNAMARRLARRFSGDAVALCSKSRFGCANAPTGRHLLAQ